MPPVPPRGTVLVHKRGAWSPDEDKKLLALVNGDKTVKWVDIAEKLGTRTSKQCRERYHQKLKPSLSHTPITPEEGAQIEHLVAIYGKRWAEISRHMKGRSDNVIKNWWNASSNRRRMSADAVALAIAKKDQTGRMHNSFSHIPGSPGSTCSSGDITPAVDGECSRRRLPPPTPVEPGLRDSISLDQGASASAFGRRHSLQPTPMHWIQQQRRMSHQPHSANYGQSVSSPVPPRLSKPVPVGIVFNSAYADTQASSTTSVASTPVPLEPSLNSSLNASETNGAYTSDESGFGSFDKLDPSGLMSPRNFGNFSFNSDNFRRHSADCLGSSDVLSLSRYSLKSSNFVSSPDPSANATKPQFTLPFISRGRGAALAASPAPSRDDYSYSASREQSPGPPDGSASYS